MLTQHLQCFSITYQSFNKIWWSNTISFASKFKLYKSLVISILHYGYKTWTLLADSEKKIQASETKCLRKLFCISHLEYKTNDWVQSKINFLVGPWEPRLPSSQRDGNLQGLSMSCAAIAFPNHPSGHLVCGWCSSQQRKCWVDNVKEWISLPMAELHTKAFCRKHWMRISAESSLMSTWWPRWLRDWPDLAWLNPYSLPKSDVYLPVAEA